MPTRPLRPPPPSRHPVGVKSEPDRGRQLKLWAKVRSAPGRSDAAPVPRTRSLHDFAADTVANFGIGTLAAGYVHVAGQRRTLVAAVDDEVVPLGLAGNRLLDRGMQEVIALGGAQRRAQVGGVLLAETHEQRAGAGDAHAIAGFAEIVGKRRDEAEPAAGLGDPHVAGRAAGAIVDLFEGEP